MDFYSQLSEREKKRLERFLKSQDTCNVVVKKTEFIPADQSAVHYATSFILY